MLFLLFQLGDDRYALEASRIVEVVPLVQIQRLPQVPKGVAGVFTYRGRQVLAIDLAELVLGRPSNEHLSTRIIIINYPDETGRNHLVGLIAEHATGTLHKEAHEVIEHPAKMAMPRHLGPILMDSNGPIQWVHEERLLPAPVSELLFAEAVARSS
jgi:chemotaxis-related protein WspB